MTEWEERRKKSNRQRELLFEERDKFFFYLSTRQQDPLIEDGGVTMTHLIVSECKVEVLLVRDMFHKMQRKTPNPRELQGPVVTLS